ncbi:MAG: hypothetical protein HOH24_07935 [Chromatiales bacterium]|nr:hypothetical protein [Chromatiales bacterium]
MKPDLKYPLAVLLIALPLLGSTQDQIDLNMELMKAMQSVQEVASLQQCLQTIDQTKLQRFRRKAEHTKAQIETLCANGERLPASDLAATFVRLHAKDQTALQVKKCTELAPGMIPQFSVATFDGSLNGRHICDL